jgi:hypothetical protein
MPFTAIAMIKEWIGFEHPQMLLKGDSPLLGIFA